MSALLIGAGVGVAGLGYSIFNAESQKHKANQIEKGLRDPVYNIPPEFYQNREIARQMAQQGIPQEAINNQTNAINQNQAGAIDAVSKSANPGAAVASIVRQGDQSFGKLNADDAQARENNQRYFINQNAQVGNQQLAKQQNDVFDKYTRQFNQMQAYRGAGMQNENAAVQDATQLGMMAANQYNQNNSKTTTTPTLAPGTAEQMQIPQQYWNMPGLGYTPPGTNPYANNPSYQKYNYNPNQ